MKVNLHSYEDNHHGVQVPFEERENAFEHSYIFPIMELNR